MKEFTKDLKNLINTHSLENLSNTPDWILAEYLTACLKNFSLVMEAREEWHGREFSPRLYVKAREEGSPSDTTLTG